MVALSKIGKFSITGADRSTRLTIISFFTPGGYYEEKAEELRVQCEDLGMAHHIKPLHIGPNVNWAEICRRKVRFYHDALKELRRPVMWVDVDSRILRNLDHLAEGPHDMALFARGFQYLPQYNITQFARSFHPGYLLMKPTQATFEFLDRCAEVEATHDGEFTDDYILEEAFRTTRAQPRLLVLTPRDILRPREPDNGEALFQHGDSGMVSEYKSKVRQHMPRVLEPAAQRTVINELAKFAARGKVPDRLVFLYRYMLNMDPEDHASYLKLLNLHHRRGNSKPLADLLDSGAASAFLRPYSYETGSS